MAAAIARSRSSGATGGTSTSGRSASHQPSTSRGVDLVEPERARHPRVDLEEERHVPDQRGHVVGVGAEREVAVAVGRAGRGEHERPAEALPQQLRHLREVVRHEVAAAVPERLARRVREEVGDVAQPVAEGAVDVRPLVQRVHLVHAHAARARRRAPRACPAARPARRWRAARSRRCAGRRGAARPRDGRAAGACATSGAGCHHPQAEASPGPPAALARPPRRARGRAAAAAGDGRRRRPATSSWRSGASTARGTSRSRRRSCSRRPPAGRDPEAECVVRMLVDHVRIRAAAQSLEREPQPLEALHELGTMLERHVRLEEREVFPLIEAAMPEDAAERLVEAAHPGRAPTRRHLDEVPQRGAGLAAGEERGEVAAGQLLGRRPQRLGRDGRRRPAARRSGRAGRRRSAAGRAAPAGRARGGRRRRAARRSRRRRRRPAGRARPPCLIGKAVASPAA